MKLKSLVVTIRFISPLVILGLASCGGGNDVASTGATAISAAAPAASTVTNSTPATTTTTTVPKLNGQIDERTGVAPVAAMTIWSPSNCLISYYSLNSMQQNACDIAASNAPTSQQCSTLGGPSLILTTTPTQSTSAFTVTPTLATITQMKIFQAFLTNSLLFVLISCGSR